MIEESFFQDEGSFHVTAASVGISHRKWIYVSKGDIENNSHILLMKKNRFDLLPIVEENGKVLSYVKTKTPNTFDEVEIRPITFEDTIKLDDNIRDVIDLFDREKKSFVFLTFQNQVKGLLTVGNFNCRQVQILLFSLICDLERNLCEFLYDHLSENEIVDWASSKAKSAAEKDKYQRMINSYTELVSSDLENKFTEHLYFVDLFNIITEKKLFEKFNYAKKEWLNFNSINEIRKRVAHPSRSLIDKDNSIAKLNQRLKKVDKLLFNLKNR